MNMGEIQEGVQIAQTAAPMVEELVKFLVGLFHKHAPKATPDQVEQAATIPAHEVLTGIANANGTAVPQVAHVVTAVQAAIANPAPAPVESPAPIQVAAGASTEDIRTLLESHREDLLDDIALMLSAKPVPAPEIAPSPAVAELETAQPRIPAAGVVFRGR